MKSPSTLIVSLCLTCVLALSGVVAAQDDPSFSLELELGPTWQSRNTVQIPNTEAGTRFSLKDLVGAGPWAAGRVYFTWNFKRRHSLRVLAAPLSYTETGIFDETVDFAGDTYEAGLPTEATYQFNSWRVGYRWRFKDGERWKLWLGFTAKIRDAKIALSQGDTSSEDTDVGFVPLLSFAADYRFSDRWHLLFDFEGRAGFRCGAQSRLRLSREVGHHGRLSHGRGWRGHRGRLQLRLVPVRSGFWGLPVLRRLEIKEWVPPCFPSTDQFTATPLAMIGDPPAPASGSPATVGSALLRLRAGPSGRPRHHGPSRRRGNAFLYRPEILPSIWTSAASFG